MNLKQFKYVVVLANEGSFGKAADALNISQPSLSQYVKNIEKQLGTQLFDRTGGIVRLTEAGHIYIDVGKRMLDLEHYMYGQINDLAEHKSGSVIVGTSPYRSACMMPVLAKRFKELYPGMHLVVEEMTTSQLIEASERGQFDFCITMLPIDEKIFTYEKICEEELLIAAPADFPVLDAVKKDGCKYPAVDFSCLSCKPFVMLTEGQLMQQQLDSLCDSLGIEVKIGAVVKSLEAQIAMVREGLGFALVPSGTEGFCKDNDVRFYSIANTTQKRQVVAMWRKDKPLNMAAQSLVKITKEYNR